jgi:creatinine amidohydrolase
MNRFGILLLATMVLGAAAAGQAQTKLSTKWEELSAADFREAIGKAQGTCLLPFGILEKHGPHLPLGTDLLNVRYVSEHAAQQEFVVIFPQYYAGQIFEAKHEPGTIAYSAELQLRLLQETTDEMARNGCKKVVIVNGPGGTITSFTCSGGTKRPRKWALRKTGRTGMLVRRKLRTCW